MAAPRPAGRVPCIRLVPDRPHAGEGFSGPIGSWWSGVFVDGTILEGGTCCGLARHCLSLSVVMSLVIVIKALPLQLIPELLDYVELGPWSCRFIFSTQTWKVMVPLSRISWSAFVYFPTICQYRVVQPAPK